MIPIYRAKKKNGSGYITGNYIDVEFSNEEYVDIDKTEEIIKHCIIKNFRTLHDDFEYCNFEIEEIDISTLSIHFPDMIDSQGNKIFASLDIKGGSLIEYEEKIFEEMYLNGLIQGVANMDSIQNSLFKYSKIIGIQQ